MIFYAVFFSSLTAKHPGSVLAYMCFSALPLLYVCRWLEGLSIRQEQQTFIALYRHQTLLHRELSMFYFNNQLMGLVLLLFPFNRWGY